LAPARSGWACGYHGPRGGDEGGSLASLLIVSTRYLLLGKGLQYVPRVPHSAKTPWLYIHKKEAFLLTGFTKYSSRHTAVIKLVTNCTLCSKTDPTGLWCGGMLCCMHLSCRVHRHRNIVLGPHFNPWISQVQTEPARPKHSKDWQLHTVDSSCVAVYVFTAYSDYMRRLLHRVRNLGRQNYLWVQPAFATQHRHDSESQRARTRTPRASRYV